MTVYVCEDCVDGIFTGVYNAWASRLGHANVALRIAGPANLELFASYRNVETDSQKAQKVADTIRRRMGGKSYEMIYRAALADAPEKADCIYRVLAVGLSCHTDSRTAHHLLERLQDANACRVFELSRKVQNEAHRYEGFVRFRELEGGILFSEIKAENQVLPLIGEHFSDRFPDEHFLIFDHHSGDCLVHAAQQQWFIWKRAGKELSRQLEDWSVSHAGTSESRDQDPGKSGFRSTFVTETSESKEQASGKSGSRNTFVTGTSESENWTLENGKTSETKYPMAGQTADLLSVDEEEIQQLWRVFFDTVSIQERENLHLQRQFWPLKFRKWMTEGIEQENPGW